MVEWPMTDADHNYLARLRSFEFGNIELENVICLFGELPPPLSMPLIGSDDFRSVTIGFFHDGSRKEVVLNKVVLFDE